MKGSYVMHSLHSSRGGQHHHAHGAVCGGGWGGGRGTCVCALHHECGQLYHAWWVKEGRETRREREGKGEGSGVREGESRGGGGSLPLPHPSLSGSLPPSFPLRTNWGLISTVESVLLASIPTPTYEYFTHILYDIVHRTSHPPTARPRPSVRDFFKHGSARKNCGRNLGGGGARARGQREIWGHGTGRWRRQGEDRRRGGGARERRGCLCLEFRVMMLLYAGRLHRLTDLMD